VSCEIGHRRGPDRSRSVDELQVLDLEHAASHDAHDLWPAEQRQGEYDHRDAAPEFAIRPDVVDRRQHDDRRENEGDRKEDVTDA
jgi:hypothetical protein